MNKNFVHQVGDQPRLYYATRSANHQKIVHFLVIIQNNKTCTIYVLTL